MSILFVGSEDISFQISGAYAVSTSGTFAATVRQSLTLSSPATTVTAPFPAGAGSFWVSLGLRKHGATTAAPLLRFQDGVTVRVALNVNAAGQFEFNNGSVLATDTRVIESDTLARYDVQVDLTNGHLRLYRNNRLVLSYDGALGGATVNQMVVTNPGADDGNNWLDLSAVIIQTTCTRRASLYTLIPTSLTEATNWIGAVSAVNEQKLDDTTYLTTNTSNAVVSAALSSSLSGSLPIRAVVESARISGADAAQIGLSSGGAYALNPAVTGSDSSVPQNYNYAVTTNPFTNSNWSVADIASIQFSIQLSDNGITYLVDQNGNTVTDENGNAVTF